MMAIAATISVRYPGTPRSRRTMSSSSIRSATVSASTFMPPPTLSATFHASLDRYASRAAASG